MTHGRHRRRGQRHQGRRSRVGLVGTMGAAPLLVAAMFSAGFADGDEQVMAITASEPDSLMLVAGLHTTLSGVGTPGASKPSPAVAATRAPELGAAVQAISRTTTRASRSSRRISTTATGSQAKAASSVKTKTVVKSRNVPRARVTNTAGPIRSHVQVAANRVHAAVPGIRSIGGTRSGSIGGEHEQGLALDFMCSAAVGDDALKYLRANWSALKIDYIIWEQRILQSPNGSWRWMEDRGGATANHMDHVHVSFLP